MKQLKSHQSAFKDTVPVFASFSILYFQRSGQLAPDVKAEAFLAHNRSPASAFPGIQTDNCSWQTESCLGADNSSRDVLHFIVSSLFLVKVRQQKLHLGNKMFMMRMGNLGLNTTEQLSHKGRFGPGAVVCGPTVAEAKTFAS